MFGFNSGSSSKVYNVPLANEPKSLTQMAISMHYLMKWSELCATGYHERFRERLSSVLKQNGIDINKVPKKIINQTVDQFDKMFSESPLQEETQQFNQCIYQFNGKIPADKRHNIMINLACKRFDRCLHWFFNSDAFSVALQVMRQHYAL